MKIITWNVNGIRAREAQVLDLLEREQPDILCLQELKAKRDQIPEALCDLGGYWCYWHGAAAYSGVSLHVRKDRFGDEPTFVHPGFDFETRIVEATLGDTVFASVYVPNGGKDFTAKVNFMNELERYVAITHDAGHHLILCGDFNVALTERDVHPKERKVNAIGQRPDERALLDRIIGRGLTDIGRALAPDDDEMFTWWAPWRNMRQRNI